MGCTMCLTRYAPVIVMNNHPPRKGKGNIKLSLYMPWRNMGDWSPLIFNLSTIHRPAVTIMLRKFYLQRKSLQKVASNCIANLKCTGLPHTSLTDVPLRCIAMTDGTNKWWKNCENINCVLLLLLLFLLLWHLIWTFLFRLKHNILTIMFLWLPLSPSTGKIKDSSILGALLDKDRKCRSV